MVFLFRGQGAIFSQSFGQMCDRLRSAAIWAEDCRCIGDRWACQQVVQSRRARGTVKPIVFIGHSRGGRRAVLAAHNLHSRGIGIESLIGIDVAFAKATPPNVNRAIHLFRTRSRIYPARPFVSSPGDSGRIENVDLDTPAAPFSPVGLHHLNITRARSVQDWIVNQAIKGIAETRRPE